MKKSDFVKLIGAAAHVSMREAERLYDAIVKMIYLELQNGGEVPLGPVGKITVVSRAERKGRNPRTGETMTIPACRVLSIRMSRTMKEKFHEAER